MIGVGRAKLFSYPRFVLRPCLLLPRCVLLLYPPRVLVALAIVRVRTVPSYSDAP